MLTYIDSSNKPEELLGIHSLDLVIFSSQTSVAAVPTDKQKHLTHANLWSTLYYYPEYFL